MKYPTYPSELFENNRKSLFNRLDPHSIAVLHSSDEFPRSGDQNFVFKQNPDFFYLSGIDQEQSILLLFPDCPNPLYREVLFLRQTNDHIKVWEGHKYTKDQARATSGIRNIQWLSEYDNILHSIIHYANIVYLNSNENDRYVYSVRYRDLRFLDIMKNKYPLHDYKRLAPILRDLRAIKSRLEIDVIQKACNITNDAFKRVLKFIKPGVKEFEIEAEVIHEFIRQGGTGHAYTPIIASGENANILHYIDNNQSCKDGDLILMDFGVEYANYNADLSRTVPVSGRYTKRQREVYDAVLRVLKASKGMLKPGVVWNEYHEQVGEVMTKELVDLKLITLDEVKNQNVDSPAYKKYFMHGNSHHLGIDVHDFAGRYTPFAAGNVLTIEPGIYIQEEGFGVRIENDVLITDSGVRDFMFETPIEAEEIESIMNA